MVRVFRMNTEKSRVPYLIAAVDLILLLLFVLVAYWHVPSPEDHTHRFKINPSTGETMHLIRSSENLE